jgi:hypothetical protein
LAGARERRKTACSSWRFVVGRAVPSIVVCLGILSIAVAGAKRARAAESADDCVRLEESAAESGLSLTVDNHCDRRLSCVLSWTVQCESATGRATRRSQDSARVVVAASSSESAFASARTCGDNWRIEDVSWECAPTAAAK